MGIAFKCHNWFVPRTDRFPDGTRFFFGQESLDASLSQIARGDSSIGLYFEHKLSTPICSSNDGCIWLTRTGNELRLKISTRNTAGRAAVAVIRASGLRGLSVGFETQRIRDRCVNGQLEVLVMKGRIREISIVSDPAVAGCRLCF
jgi:phage head maturation protease